jgi:hypothetical protein
MISSFAGNWNAVAFAYGLAGSKFPQALLVNVGISVAATAALQLDFGYTVTEDGIQFSPLNTNAPVIFGSGANAETLTPSAVSNGTPLIYGSSTVTAAFANTHGQGDTLSSGTAGLQEAINYVAGIGGGTVVVDAKWAALGGTSAMIAAATVPATVSIQDNRATGGVGASTTVSVALANAQMLALHGTAVQVVPAQGAGTLIEVVSMVFDAKFNTAAFAGGSTIGLNYGSGGTACSALIATTVLTSFAADQSILIAGALAVTVNSSILNKAVVIQATCTEYTNAAGGLSTAIVHVTYRVHRGL